MLALCWRCGGSLVALQNTTVSVWSPVRICHLENSEVMQGNCTIKLLKYFSKFFKFNIYQPTSSKGKLKNTFVAASVHKYCMREGRTNVVFFLCCLFPQLVGEGRGGGLDIAPAMQTGHDL